MGDAYEALMRKLLSFDAVMGADETGDDVPGGGMTVRDSRLESVSANHQKKIPTGRSAAAATCRTREEAA